MKILIADDDATIHAGFTKFLTKKGFEVLSAFDGKDARQIAVEQVPDIILLDILMPEMDGRDVCRKLKNDPVTKHIKIIILSSKDQDIDRNLGFKLGADEYIEKPCDLFFLGRVIDNFVRKMKD